jgi:hypothetical protein
MPAAMVRGRPLCSVSHAMRWPLREQGTVIGWASDAQGGMQGRRLRGSQRVTAITPQAGAGAAGGWLA